MTIDQLTYYDPKGPTTLEHVLPTIETTIDIISIPFLFVIVPSLFTRSLLMESFFPLPPHPSMVDISYLCTITYGKNFKSSQPQPQPQMQTLGNYWGSFPIHTTQFLFPPSGIVSKMIMATLNILGFTLGILVWYLDLPIPP